MGADDDREALDYAAATGALERALVFGIHPSLDGIRELTETLGRPQDTMRFVQVTGTNGKTSTARLIEALLRAQGVATGLYTSPHLERYPERVEIGGAVVSDGRFGAAVLAVLESAEKMRPGAHGTPEGFTEFELLTAAALWLFREARVEVAVLEVGLGGTWDATSVVAPAVAVITGVALDHAAILGDSLDKIASEKAGIIKPGATVVLGPGVGEVEGILRARAYEAGAPVIGVRPNVGQADDRLEDGFARFSVRSHSTMPLTLTVFDVETALATYAGLEIAAPGYQAGNVATAIASVEALLNGALSADGVGRALEAVTFPGRFETVLRDPLVVVDGSHNPQAAAVLAESIVTAWPSAGAPPQVLLGVLADKDAEGIVAAFQAAGVRIAAVCTPRSDRALPAEKLAEIVEAATDVAPAVFSDVPSALGALLSTAGSGLVVTGSLTTAGEARSWLRSHGSARAAR
jgi:dihydrofolate synthase/folylpolyglutamate synthase